MANMVGEANHRDLHMKHPHYKEVMKEATMREDTFDVDFESDNKDDHNPSEKVNSSHHQTNVNVGDMEGESDNEGELIVDLPQHQNAEIGKLNTASLELYGPDEELVEGEPDDEGELIVNLPQHQNVEIGKLNTASLELYGRDEELAVLKFSFERMMKTTHGSILDSKLVTKSFTTSGSHKELVFIQGMSGVGKSSLAKSIHQAVDELENGLYVEGKFDLMISNEPYSGVAKAFGAICQQLLSSKKESIAAVGRMIANELHHEMEILFPLIPELKAIVDKYSSLTPRPPTYSSDHGSQTDGKSRWKYAFRLLSRVLNAAYTPMVLVLDDLHWADASSLQVIDYLVSDLQNTNQLMIIGCYLSEKVGPLLDVIHDLEEKQENYSFHITEIELQSCQEETINEMLMAMMSTKDEKETEELAEICYRHTAGNPFFVQQFMLMLENESLLSYDTELQKWTWDTLQIKRQITFTSGVVDLLQGRMKKTSEDVQLLLQYAACLGTTFALPTIDIVWKDHQIGHGDENSDTASMLKIMQDESFIEEYDSKCFRWVHDRVQEAAMSLTGNVAASASFKCKVGKALLSALDEEQLEDELFDVVDLINRGNVATRPELASLNLRAAMKAKSLSAFESASKYVEFGAAMLPRDHWTFYRKLTLDLYTLGAETEIVLGNHRAAAAYCNAVFQRDDCSVMEKMPFRMAVIRKISGGDAEMKKKALKMCLDTLRDLDYKFSWGKGLLPFQTIICLYRTLKAMKKRLGMKSLDASLGEMTDPRHLAIVQLLERVGSLAYSLELFLTSGLSSCHIVDMTLKHGKNFMASFGFVNIGILSWMIMKEDFGTVCAIAEEALSIEHSLEGQTTLSSYGWVLCWKKELSICSNAFECAYHSSMRIGDVESAMWILCLYQFWIPFVMGAPLASLLQIFPRLVSYMEEHHQHEAALTIKMAWQGFLNLTTGTGRNTRLEGFIYSASEHSSNTGAIQAVVHLVEGELHFSSSYETAAERSIRFGDKYQKLCPALFVGMIEIFHRGVALYVMARKTKKRRYKTRAAKIRKTVKQWVKDGNPNVEHYDLLLDAEHFSLKLKSYDSEHDGKSTKGYAAVDKLYQEAIDSANEASHLQHSAVCNERYADFLLHIGWNKSGWAHHLSKAAELYEKWGAVGKVKELKLKLQTI